MAGTRAKLSAAGARSKRGARAYARSGKGGAQQRPGGGGLNQSALQELAGYHIRRADVHMNQHFARTLAKLHVRPAEYSVMLLVASNPYATQSDIAAALDIRRPNLVGLILRLERRGVLRRERYEHDRRNHMLCLTQKGQTLLGEVNRLVRGMDRRVTRCWTERERGKLIELLLRLYGAG